MKEKWISLGSRHLDTNYIIILKCWKQRNSGTFRLSSASLHDVTLIIAQSVTVPSVSCRKSLYGDPRNYRGQKYCSHRQEHGMVFRSPVRHPIVEPQGYFHEVDLSVYCTNTDHAGAPLQNWTNKYTVIYLDGYSRDVASDGMRDWLWVHFINPALPSTRH